MDRWEFTASLVRSLAWPAVVVTGMVLFRSVIRTTLDGQVKRWRVGPLEAEYWHVRAVEAGELLPPEVKEGATDLASRLVEELTPVAEVAPQAAVVEAFDRVEQQLRLTATGLAPPERLGVLSGWELSLLASESERISPWVLRTVGDLQLMRNLAIHRELSDLAEMDALMVVRLMASVLWALREKP